MASTLPQFSGSAISGDNLQNGVAALDRLKGYGYGYKAT